MTALAADAAGAGQLDVSVAAPVLAIERIAYALDGRPVELRSSLFALAGAAYHSARTLAREERHAAGPVRKQRHIPTCP